MNCKAEVMFHLSVFNGQDRIVPGLALNSLLCRRKVLNWSPCPCLSCGGGHTMFGFCDAGTLTWGFMHAEQALCRLSYISSQRFLPLGATHGVTQNCMPDSKGQEACHLVSVALTRNASACMAYLNAALLFLSPVSSQ